jgi:hypothetical protein
MLRTFRVLTTVGLAVAFVLFAALTRGGGQKVGEGSPGSSASLRSQDDALVILSTPDLGSFQGAIAAVRDNGGEVPQAYPPNAFVATLNPGVESALSQLPAVARIERRVVDPTSLTALGGQAETAAHIWNAVFRGVPDAIAAAAPSGLPPERQGPDFLIPPPEAPGIQMAPGAPTSTQTSEFMAGTVVYTVVFVESSGGTGNCSPADAQTENWSPARQTTVLSEISDGLAFWTGRSNRPSPLTFTLDNRGSQPTSCEPISRPSGDESKWIADVLKALGRSGATPSNYWHEAVAYADSRRTALGADWGYLIFVVDSLSDADGMFTDSSFAYAYLNGPFMVMTYENGNWGIGQMNLVTAHQTGHIFGALAEYASSLCSTADSWGYLNVANASCNNGGNTSDISIMGEGSEMQNAGVDVSTSARGAIGWRNPVGTPVVVDVVRTATVSLTPYTPDPTFDDTPTYSASAGNTPFPPEGPRMYGGYGYGTASPVTVSKVAGAQWNLDGGAFTSAGVVPSDGAFDEESDAYTFTPASPVPAGPHTFGTRSTNNFGDVSSPATDELTISTAMLTSTATATTTPPPTPTPTLTPTPNQQQIFNNKLARLVANAESMPTPVSGAIDSLTKTVTKTFNCPPGSPVTKVTVNITTTVENWDPAKAVPNSDGTYGWNCTGKVSGGEKTYTCRNWVMLDPAVTVVDEAEPPMGPIVDEGLLYHELLHGQLLINAMDTPAWQAEACKCNFVLEPADEDHSEINPLQDGYLDARGGVDVKVVEPGDQIADPDGHFGFDLGPTEKDELDGFWVIPDPEFSDPGFNVEDIDVKTGDEDYFRVTGKLIDETRKGMFWIRIDPLGEWIIGGLEHALVVLPASGVGGIAELPEVADAPLETQERAATNYGLWAGIAAVGAVGAITLGAGVWYARRRWLR